MQYNLSDIAKQFIDMPVRPMESLKLKSGLKIQDCKKVDCIGFLLLVLENANIKNIEYSDLIEKSLYRPSKNSDVNNSIRKFLSENTLFKASENIEPRSNSILVFLLEDGYLHFGFCDIENEIQYIIHANSTVKKITREIFDDNLKKFLINIITINTYNKK